VSVVLILTGLLTYLGIIETLLIEHKLDSALRY